MNVEQKLVSELQNNEHVIQILPVDELLMEQESLKNGVKTVASLVSPAIDLNTARKLIREFGIHASNVVIKNYGPKQYIIFKGHPGTRRIFRGTRYLANNPKVVRLAIGPKGIINAAKGGFVITVVLSVGIEIFNYFMKDKSTLPKLLGTVSGDLIKFGISAIVGAVAGLAIGSATVIGTVAAAPIIIAVGVGVLTGYVLSKIDAKLGATAILIKAYENLGIKLSDIKYEANRVYNYLEDNPSAIMRLFGGPVFYGYGY